MWIAYLAAGLVLFICLCLGAAYPLVKRHELGNNQSPSKYGLNFEEITFITRDKIALQGWWIKSPQSTSTVIFLHGYAGSMDPDLKYVLHFNTAGFNVLMFDFRAHGRSAGSLTSLGALEVEDVAAAVRLAESRGSTRIGLLGFSMGGRAALLSAPHLPQVKAVVSDSAPARLTTVIQAELHRRKIPAVLNSILALMVVMGASLFTRRNLFHQEVLHLADQITQPVMYIYGGKDPYVTRAEIDQLVNSTADRAILHYVPNAEHRRIDELMPDEYMNWLIGFFKKMDIGGDNEED